jgi:hypothetical protein
VKQQSRHWKLREKKIDQVLYDYKNENPATTSDLDRNAVRNRVVNPSPYALTPLRG